MKTIASQLEDAFRTAIQTAFGFEADPLLAPTQNDKFGDYQSNVAMGLAKQVTERTGAKSNPRAVAEQIKANLKLEGIASEVSIAGPGFINVRLSPEWLAGQLNQIARDPRLGVDPVSTPQTVVVDYSGPNIAKQMHVGHLRSTIIGDSVARVLAFLGNDVIRQNHLGDWGTQFGRVVLAMWYEAVFEKSGNTETLKALMSRQADAARSFSEAKERGDDERIAKQAYESSIGEIVREIAPLHQRLINDDPQGTRYFLPYLTDGSLDLDELERAYVFVSAITENPAAKEVTIERMGYTPERVMLNELTRLTTRYIQNPDSKDNDNSQEQLAWRRASEITLVACRKIYRRLNVQLADQRVQTETLERGESFYNPDLPDVVASLKDKGLATVSAGATVIEVPGYENPLIIEKGGGGYLYGTTDLAAVRYRVDKLKAHRIIYFVDARQASHFAQVFWTARAAGWANGIDLMHAAFGTMLGPDGRPFKTRSGDTVKLKDLLDEAEERAFAQMAERMDFSDEQKRQIATSVGIGAVKYADLSKDRTSDYAFSFEAILSLQGNTAPYMQYAYARIQSILRKAVERGVLSQPDQLGTISLATPQELLLAKQILRFGEVIEAIDRELKPHLLCTYLYDLAGRFSGFFENCPVLQSEEPTRSSRLALVGLTAKTLAMGLDLLGIEHPNQM